MLTDPSLSDSADIISPTSGIAYDWLDTPNQTTESTVRTYGGV